MRTTEGNSQSEAPSDTHRHASGVGLTQRRPNQSTAIGGAMADLDVTKKARIYHTLSLLNSLFPAIVEHCQTLQETGILKPKFTRLYQCFAQELQAEITGELCETLPQIER